MDAPLKKILRALSLELRHTLEGTYTEDGTWKAGDLERRLNQIGIWRDRPVKPISEMPNLSPMDRKARELIDAYLALRSDAGVSQSDAVAEFIRESAYSWANRLFALRCMEARGIIDPVILQEEAYHGRSMVHDRFAQTNPTQCTDEDDGLFVMLSEEFREHSQELPDLFEPDSPAVTLRPSVVALKHCIALLSGSVPANGGRVTDDVFTAPDAFGWAYQYWNAEEKNRVFEMVRTKKGAKIEGSDIIPATQLYTEPYMVKFLVQNSLGATWMMMHPESNISTSWEYYVKDADRTPIEKKPVAEITFLDPACGSGHFLIEAFDILYAMYEEERLLKEPAVICQSILNNNLFGIDIDERAVQITKAVLWMKAAETVFAKTKQQLTGDDFSEFHDHIIATNIRLPNGKDHLDAFLKKHPEDAPLRPALLTVFEGLQNVHELGSLVQIEEPVDNELKALKEQAKQQRLDPESGGEMVERIDFPRWKKQVMKRLKAHFQDEAEKALPTEAFFSQSAVKGLALFDLLARRYDVVAANPPYMGSGNMGNQLKMYLELNYKFGKNDLYSAFVLRCIMLSKSKAKIALITQESWMFKGSFANIRSIESTSKSENIKSNFRGVLRDTAIECIIHLGPNAFTEVSGEVVSSTMFVLSNFQPLVSHTVTGMNLVHAETINEKIKLFRNIILGRDNQHFFNIKQSFFLEIPQSPICYSLNIHFFSLIQKNRLNNVAKTVIGLQTSDDLKYIRFYWEVVPALKTQRWFLFQKGGGYSKWYGLNYYVVEWENEGKRIKAFPISYPRNEKYYFTDGWTYSANFPRNFAARKMSKSIFSTQSPGIIKLSDVPVGAFLSCRLSSYLLRSICSQNNYVSESYISKIPIPTEIPSQISMLETTCVCLKRLIVGYNLIEPDFNNTATIKDIELKFFRNSSILHTFEGICEDFIFNSYNLKSEEKSKIIAEVGTPIGWFPLIVDYDNLPSFSKEFPELATEMFAYLNNHKRITLPSDRLVNTKQRLYSYYKAGPGVKEEVEDNKKAISEIDDDSLVIGARIPLPPETFLEELSQKMEIHPITLYWLLKEGIEKEGWRCIPEEKRYTEDHFTVMVLQLLGHRWPKQIEAGDPVPEWADADGIIPITAGLTHPTLLKQIRDRITAEFPSGKVHEIEKVFEEVVGMPLERWLAGEFFKHHISQFKKRPIAWQLSSSTSSGAGGKGKGSRREPAFSCIIYYHKIDVDILHKIKTQYVGDLINRYETELRALAGREKLTGDQATRKVQLDNWIDELNDFSNALQDVADGGFESTVLREIVEKEPLDKWTSRDGKVPHPKSVEDFFAQEKRYDPDINDGVRVNIIPLQKAGLLASDVISKKDVEKAIADRAEWRATERRWCREGKLPKCGWWEG